MNERTQFVLLIIIFALSLALLFFALSTIGQLTW